MRMLTVALLCALLASCGVPEIVKQTNEQNLGGARKIREISTEKPVQAIAADIEANSKALQDYLGKAEKALEYSKAESARLRKELEEARAAGPWGWLGGGAVAIGGLIWSILRTTQAGQLVDVFVGQIQRVKDKAKTGALTEADVDETLDTGKKALPIHVRARADAAVGRFKKKAAKVVRHPAA